MKKDKNRRTFYLPDDLADAVDAKLSDPSSNPSKFSEIMQNALYQYLGDDIELIRRRKTKLKEQKKATDAELSSLEKREKQLLEKEKKRKERLKGTQGVSFR